MFSPTEKLTMKLSTYSHNRLMHTFSQYQVARDYADPIYNYLVHGFPPGSFFTALLANDAMRMIASSHPSNTIPSLKNLVAWIRDYLGESTAHGSYELVNSWLKTTPEERREELEALGLVYPEKVEIIKILSDEPTHEPHLW